MKRRYNLHLDLDLISLSLVLGHVGQAAIAAALAVPISPTYVVESLLSFIGSEVKSRDGMERATEISMGG